jgi:Flp pilus assembly protein TadG
MKTLPMAQSGSFMRKLRSFRAAQAGAAAIEFALIVPVMIGMYIMLYETAGGLRASRKTTMTARVMADLASRPANINDTDRDDIFNAARPIMSPFDSTKGAYRITSIRFDASGKGYVDWSEVRGTHLGAAYPRCSPTEARGPLSPVSVPAGLKVANTSVILAESMVKYKPIIGYNITGEIDLTDKLFMRPRVTDFVTRNGAANTPCPTT